MWPFKRRFLFRYHNGVRRVAADPLVILRRIMQQADELQVLATLFDQMREPEATEYIMRVADVFGIVRWDPERNVGLTDLEVLDVLRRFNALISEVRDRFFSGSIRRPSMDGESSSSAASANETRGGDSLSSSPDTEPSSDRHGL